jgi:hypothetical protein
MITDATMSQKSGRTKGQPCNRRKQMYCDILGAICPHTYAVWLMKQLASFRLLHFKSYMKVWGNLREKM